MGDCKKSAFKLSEAIEKAEIHFFNSVTFRNEYFKILKKTALHCLSKTKNFLVYLRITTQNISTTPKLKTGNILT